MSVICPPAYSPATLTPTSMRTSFDTTRTVHGRTLGHATLDTRRSFDANLVLDSLSLTLLSLTLTEQWSVSTPCKRRSGPDPTDPDQHRILTIPVDAQLLSLLGVTVNLLFRFITRPLFRTHSHRVHPAVSVVTSLHLITPIRS